MLVQVKLSGFATYFAVSHPTFTTTELFFFLCTDCMVNLMYRNVPWKLLNVGIWGCFCSSPLPPPHSVFWHTFTWFPPPDFSPLILLWFSVTRVSFHPTSSFCCTHTQHPKKKKIYPMATVALFKQMCVFVCALISLSSVLATSWSVNSTKLRLGPSLSSNKICCACWTSWAFPG